MKRMLVALGVLGFVCAAANTTRAQEDLKKVVRARDQAARTERQGIGM